MKKITICGSMVFFEKMIELKSKLEKMGYLVYIPESFQETGAINYYEYSQEEGKHLKIQHNLIKEHYSKILMSDAVFIANFEKEEIMGYVGGNTLLELGFAHVNNKDIFMANNIPDLKYRTEIEAMQPIIIGSDFTKITKYYEDLPKVFLSSISGIKLDAVSLSFKNIGLNYDIKGVETLSNVAEQPMSIDETYQGARNRMNDLKKQVSGRDYEYLVSIECGLVKLHDNHNYFNITICLIENKDGEEKLSLVTDIEFPKEMTDLIPSKYSDLGVLVQKRFGSKHKDPFQFFTNGKIKRIDLLIYPIRNAILQFNSVKI